MSSNTYGDIIGYIMCHYNYILSYVTVQNAHKVTLPLVTENIITQRELKHMINWRYPLPKFRHNLAAKLPHHSVTYIGVCTSSLWSSSSVITAEFAAVATACNCGVQGTLKAPFLSAFLMLSSVARITSRSVVSSSGGSVH